MAAAPSSNLSVSKKTNDTRMQLWYFLSGLQLKGLRQGQIEDWKEHDTSTHKQLVMRISVYVRMYSEPVSNEITFRPDL